MTPLTYQTQSDEMLLARHVQGDEGAFGHLVERYQARLFSYLCRLVGHRNTAEDLLQDTFVRALTHLWQFCPDRSFCTWLYTIATNLARKELRKKRRRVQECMLSTWPDLSDPKQDHVEEVIYKETQQRLAKSIGTLKEAQRTVFILRFYQELSYEQIAEIVGCKPATARTRMFYALEKLRAALKEQEKI